RGDVDFGQPASADHIDADEQQPALPELGTERRTNFLFPRGQLGLRGFASDRQVRTNLACTRHAVDRSDDFAVNKDDALIAIRDLGKEFLDDVRLAIGLVEQLDQRSEVAPLGPDPEHRAARESVQRLDHDVAVLGQELAGETFRARDRGRRHELRKVEHPDFLWSVADACGIVDYERLAFDALEQVSRRYIAKVEGRILPHQDDVDILAEVEDARFAEAVMAACDPLDGDGIAHRPQPPFRKAEVFGRIIVETMSEFLRLEHDREGRIAVDVDLLERIHLDGDAQAHGPGALVGHATAVTRAIRW